MKGRALFSLGGLAGVLVISAAIPHALAQQAKHGGTVKASSESFETALAKVMAAAEDNFRPITGNPTNGGPPPEYYARVALPGFRCRIVDGDDNWYTRAKGEQPTKLDYTCVLVSGYFTPSMERAYEDLVEKVKMATKLPARPVELDNVQARPGSDEFERSRATYFVNDDSGTYVAVGLYGSFSHWSVELKVGAHFPH